MIESAKDVAPMSMTACRPSRSVWLQQTADGEVLWSWITLAFTCYWILFVAGAFLHHKELNVAGGVVVLGVLSLIVIERLWVRLDAVVILSMAAAVFLPVVQTLFGAPPTPDALFKHVALCLVMAMSRMLHLPLASQTRNRKFLTAQILTILLISLTLFKGSSWDGGTRHSGLFVNPNNLALIPFLLLFFINPRKDRWPVYAAAHGIVIAVLAFSATTGAVLAYGIGLLVYFIRMVPKSMRSLVTSSVILLAVAAIAFFALGGERLLPQTRMINQVSVMRGELKNVIDGVDIAYYEQERVLGSGSASGIWRLMHWRKTITTYFGGNIPQQLFGFGIGSSPRVLGVLPHNEYLRMLFEQGLAGLLLFLFAWKRILSTASADVRYIGLIIALYSFSENNLDNFPFMALFILCLSARALNEEISAERTMPTLQLLHPDVSKAANSAVGAF